MQDAAAQLAVERARAATGRAHARRLRGAGRQDLPPARAGRAGPGGHGARRVASRACSACARTSSGSDSTAQLAAGDAAEAGDLVGRPAVRPDPAGRAVFSHRGHPPAPGHQGPAARERHAGAGPAPAGPAARPPGACCARAARFCIRAVRCWRPRTSRVVAAFLARHRRPGTARRSGPPAGHPGLPGEGPGYQVHAGRGRHGRLLLCLSREAASDVGNEPQPRQRQGRIGCDSCGACAAVLLCFLATGTAWAAAESAQLLIKSAQRVARARPGRLRARHARSRCSLPEDARKAIDGGLTMRLTYEIEVSRVRR